MIVFLDPGHNGANDASISRQVPTGRGGTKDCQASGTSTNDGYPEHTFTWETVLRIRQELTALGVRTAMSRGDDTGLGPCVDERAAMANALQPDADRVDPRRRRPAHRAAASTSTTPRRRSTTSQAGPSVQFAQIMRDQLQAAGMTPANYIGQGGLYPRSDLAGLNLAQYPSILVECGNMKNPADAALIETRRRAGRSTPTPSSAASSGFLGTQS